MSRRSRVLLWLLALGGTGLAFAGAAMLLAAPLATHFTRKALSSIEGARGTFRSARLNPLTLTYSLESLMLIADDARPGDAPLLTVAHLELHASGRELLRGRVVVSAAIARAKLATRLTKGGAASVPDPGAILSELPPLRLKSLTLHDCELLLTDATVSPSAVLWVHGIEADVEGVATRRVLAGAPVATYRIHGIVQRSGKLGASGTLDPLASSPTFEGEVRLTDLRLAEGYALIAPRSGFQIPEGTVSMTGTVRASRGRLQGTIQPVFSGLEVRSAGGNILKTIEAGLANAKIGAIPERFQSERAATFDVPWTSPGALWDELLGRGREALVEAVGSPVAAKVPAPSAPKGVRSRRRVAP